MVIWEMSLILLTKDWSAEGGDTPEALMEVHWADSELPLILSHRYVHQDTGQSLKNWF